MARGKFSFPATDRLSGKADFDFVFSKGLKLAGNALAGYLVQLEPGGQTKVGLAVSRKVGNAVVRNRVKRRIREGYRALKPLIRTPFYLVVIARPAAAELDSSDALEAMRRLLVQGGVLDG